jgi:WD40-like Beta Propeller Repeat
MSVHRLLGVVPIACIAALVLAPAASADILAAVAVASPDDTNSDIAIVNASTGVRQALPSGVNTADNELHPSITPDGKRLVFQRLGSGGTDRIIVADLSTSTTADLFNTFAATQFSPEAPLISNDGSSVLTGGPFTTTASLTATPLSSFPLGPFSHNTTPFGLSLAAGELLSPVQRGSITAAALGTSAAVALTGNSTEILLHSSTHDLAFPSGSTSFYGSPALDNTDGIVVYERANDVLSPYTLRYRSSDPGTTTTSDTAFPAIVNHSGAYDIHPAFTPDDRFLGFVRFSGGSNEFLYVFDTQTQTLVNPDGVDLGAMKVFTFGFGFPDLLHGGLSLRQQPVFTISSLVASGLLTGRLLNPSGIGILVEKIVGQHKLLGRTVPTLQAVGRVPLGNHRKGAFKIKWDHRVNGKPLKPGRYLVTIRAVTGTTVHDFGRSFTVRIH